MVQTSYTATPTAGKAGLVTDVHIFNELIDTGRVDRTGGIAPGLVCLRTAGGDRSVSTQPLIAIAADDDAILTALATAASEQVIDTEANGVVALTRISPPRKITITRSSHADQDAVTAVLVGLDENGLPVTESFSFADGGGDSFTSSNRYSYFQSLTIPAQAGTGGTTKIGIAADATLDGMDVMGVSCLTQKALIAPSSSNNEVYEDDDVIPLLRRGRIWVPCETAWKAGECPLVRLIAAGAEVYGKVRAESTDSGDAWPWRNARFVDTGTAAGLAKLEVNLK